MWYKKVHFEENFKNIKLLKDMQSKKTKISFTEWDFDY